ncbi:restriction endonuclease subunit S [Streptosporangium canum]|uniref:restriction endonuclease subunit S n=1 Tax=Streptosporangium canum TaxID=324952 RepID=UPI003427DE0A
MTIETRALGELITPAPVVRAGNETYPILSMTMHHGLVMQGEKFKKRIASHDTSTYKVAKRGQLVVGFPIDEAVLSFQGITSAGIVSPAYEIWDVKDSQVDRKYLERYLRSPMAITYYKSKLRSTTARRRSIPRSDFLNLRIPFPCLTEQRRTAEILDRVDELRTKRRQTIALLDELAQSVFLDMFGDPLSNPIGWHRQAMSELGTVVTGNTPSRKDVTNYGSDIEWIKSDNIDPPRMFVSEASERLSSKGAKIARIVDPNSILITCIAGSPNSIGNAAIAGRRVAFNQQINAFTPKGVDLLYALMHMRVGKRLTQEKSTGGMQGLVSKSNFSSIQLMVPPLPLQREFAQRLQLLERQRDVQEEHRVKLDELFTSLQTRAFRGGL